MKRAADCSAAQSYEERADYGVTSASPSITGTVILTGTPHGVGMARKPPRWLQDGDSVTIEIERIGKLTNPVVLEK